MANEAQNPLVAVREQLTARLPEFKHALPPQIPPERFVRVALTAVQQTPELVVVERRSLINALLRCAADGLVPDGRQAAIVPFNDNNQRSPTYKKQIAVYMPMVAGMLARFRNSGQFKAVSTNVVREGEPFRHWIDETGEHLMHEPGEDESRPIIKAYALATTKDGGTALRVMSREAIEKRRNVSRAKDGPMWREWYAEACQKTVLRNLMKLLPSSSDDIDHMIARDDALEFGDDTAILPAPSEPRERPSLASALAEFGGESPAAVGEGGEHPGNDAPPIQPSQDDDAPPLTPHGEQLAAEEAARQIAIGIARALGVRQRAEGVARKAVPPEYRAADRAAEAIAWRDGWDSIRGDQT